MLCGLAAAFPQEGGDYVYLSRAYGPWAGFLFGWAQLAVVRPGDIAVVAFAFATYAQTIYDPLAGTDFPLARQGYAILVTGVLTVINVLGVREGKWTQTPDSAKALDFCSSPHRQSATRTPPPPRFHPHPAFTWR